MLHKTRAQRPAKKTSATKKHPQRAHAQRTITTQTKKNVMPLPIAKRTTSHHTKPQAITPITTPLQHFTTKTPMAMTTPSFPKSPQRFTATPTTNMMMKKMTQPQSKQLPFHKIMAMMSTEAGPEVVTITYIEPDGEVVPLKIKKADYADDSLMTLAVKQQVDMEGSCDGQLACSTCHCILAQEVYDELQKLKPPTEEEIDMLDTAFGLTSTSRLGCQIPVKMINKDITLKLPSFSR